MSKVIYLNRYLNCSDEELRKNYVMQDKITEARNHFFYRMKEQGIADYQLWICYTRWYHSNRDKLKIARESDQA